MTKSERPQPPCLESTWKHAFRSWRQRVHPPCAAGKQPETRSTWADTGPHRGNPKPVRTGNQPGPQWAPQLIYLWLAKRVADMTESTKARYLSDLPHAVSTASVRNPAAPARLNQRRAHSRDCCLNICAGIITSGLRRRGSSPEEGLDLALNVAVDIPHHAVGAAWRGAQAARDVSSPARAMPSQQAQERQHLPVPPPALPLRWRILPLPCGEVHMRAVAMLGGLCCSAGTALASRRASTCGRASPASSSQQRPQLAPCSGVRKCDRRSKPCPNVHCAFPSAFFLPAPLARSRCPSARMPATKREGMHSRRRIAGTNRHATGTTGTQCNESDNSCL